MKVLLRISSAALLGLFVVGCSSSSTDVDIESETQIPNRAVLYAERDGLRKDLSEVGFFLNDIEINKYRKKIDRIEEIQRELAQFFPHDQATFGFIESSELKSYRDYFDRAQPRETTLAELKINFNALQAQVAGLAQPTADWKRKALMAHMKVIYPLFEDFIFLRLLISKMKFYPSILNSDLQALKDTDQENETMIDFTMNLIEQCDILIRETE